RSTRLARSVRECDTLVSCAISSLVIASSTACRHPAMMPLLVTSITNEESTTILPVPSVRTCQTHPDSWNRSSSQPDADTFLKEKSAQLAHATLLIARPFFFRLSIQVQGENHVIDKTKIPVMMRTNFLLHSRKVILKSTEVAQRHHTGENYPHSS